MIRNNFPFPDGSSQIIIKNIWVLNFEALFTAIWLLLIPVDPKNAWLFGYSKTRLGMLAGVALLAFAGLGLIMKARRSPAWFAGVSRRIQQVLENPGLVKGIFLIAAAVFFSGLYFLALTFSTRDPFLEGVLSRLAPFTFWATLLSVQSLLFLSAIGSPILDLSGDLQHRVRSFLLHPGVRDSAFRAGQQTWKWRVDLPFLLILISVVVWVTLRTGSMLIDDAWISFKFARNLAGGFGLVWEPSAPPVEGYSNLLEVLIIALGFRLDFSPVIVSRVLGAVSTVGLITTSYLLILRVTGQRILAILPLLLYSLQPAAALHTWAGLETQLFAFLSALLLGFEEAVSGNIAGQSRSNARSAGLRVAGVTLVAFLLMLARTEGVLIGLISLPAGFFLAAHEERRAWGLGVAGFLSGAGAYTLFRWRYFGTLFTGPNLVKLSNHMALGGLASREFLADALGYFSGFPLGVAVFSLIIAAAFYLRDALRGGRRTIASSGWGLFILSLLQFGALNSIYARTKMIQNFGARFFLNTSAQQIVLAALGLALIVRAWLEFVARPPQQMARNLFLLVVAGLLVVFAYNWLQSYGLVTGGFRNFVEEYNQQQSAAQAIAKTLRRSDLADEWLVTVVDSGIAPYFAGMKTLGGDGLTDLGLAGLVPPGNERARPYAERIFSFNPGVLIIERFPGSIDTHHGALLCDPQFRDYNASARFERNNGLAYEVYIRNDLAKREQISHSLLAKTDPAGGWSVALPDPNDPLLADYVAVTCP